MSDVVDQAKSSPRKVWDSLWSFWRRLTKRQDESIYPEGKAVYVKYEGEGKTKFWVEEAKDGVYILREDEKKGEKVMWDKKFAEEDLKEIPWTTDDK